MKKYLLSFLLISLTIIGDGYAGSCKAYSKRDAYKNTDNDFLDLMCEENKKNEAVVRDDYGGYYDVEKFDYWGIDCVTDSNSCAGNQHVIVWGKHKKGNEQGVYTGVDIYECIDKADDEWNAKTTGSTKAYQLIQDCGSTVDGMTKVVSTNGYDIYVRVIDAFSKCETRAYTFASMSSSYICKKAADVAEKKCGKTPNELGNSVLVEKNDGGDSSGGDSSAESQVVEEICGGVQCNSGMNGKSIFCAENKDDTFVYKCESGYWSEVGVYGYCCNKNCSKPKKTNLVLGGSWTTDTGHEMWFSTTARISEIAWLFNSTDVNNNCTICKEGTEYNKNSGKCE